MRVYVNVDAEIRHDEDVSERSFLRECFLIKLICERSISDISIHLISNE